MSVTLSSAKDGVAIDRAIHQSRSPTVMLFGFLLLDLQIGFTYVSEFV